MQKSDTEMYALYVQDDFRIRDKLTLNLGLRWEYEGGLFDPEYRLPREVDLTQPIPGLQAAIDPRIPANIKAMMAESAGQKSYIYNGAYYFTDEEHPRNAQVSALQFMPRIGLAWSVNRQTAVRAGYGRFYTPQMLVNENSTMGQLDLGAFSPMTPIIPAVQGVPQVTLVEPVPARPDAGVRQTVWHLHRTRRQRALGRVSVSGRRSATASASRFSASCGRARSSMRRT